MWPFKCRHQAADYGRGPVYGYLQYHATEQSGIVHAAVQVECGKCGENFTAAMLYVPQGGWPKRVQPASEEDARSAAIEAMESALHYHGTMLMSDPPQDAWVVHGVARKLRNAIAALHQEPQP